MKTEQMSISLPPRTRSIIEKKLVEKAAMQALIQAEEKSISDLIEAAREMLGVPPDWVIRSTESGFGPVESKGPEENRHDTAETAGT